MCATSDYPPQQGVEGSTDKHFLCQTEQGRPGDSYGAVLDCEEVGVRPLASIRVEADSIPRPSFSEPMLLLLGSQC